MPLSASSKRPSLRSVAPVKAPFSCPKSSDSISDSVSAAQLIAINGPRLRRLALWTARATISLPLPDSPVSNTVASLGPTLATKSKIARAGGELPMKSLLASFSVRASFSRMRASRASNPARAAEIKWAIQLVAITST